MLLLPAHIPVQAITHPLFTQQKIEVNILRLDTVHPVVSGNKLYKLYYFIEQAIQYPNKTILTFGGAFSNHLVATAFICKEMNIKCTGIIRGEKPSNLSHTLLQCEQYGMNLIFLSREDYQLKNDKKFLDYLQFNTEDYILIPEGGYHPLGAQGASLIMDMVDNRYTHICTAVGTATTLAGLIMGKKGNQHIIGFSALKNLHDISDRINYLVAKNNSSLYTIMKEYHFGGYAKKTTKLIEFMNFLWKEYQIPTDFVYTSKMIFGIFDLIQKKYFVPNSNIMIIHTGGLQGNLSLPKDTLTF